MQIIQNDKTVVGVKHFISVLLQLPLRWVHIKRFTHNKYTDIDFFPLGEWKKASGKNS